MFEPLSDAANRASNFLKKSFKLATGVGIMTVSLSSPLMLLQVAQNAYNMAKVQ